MNRSRRILIIPSWYPPDGGYFFKEHSEAIRHLGWETDVLVNRVVGVRKMMQSGFRALKRYRISDENGLRVFRSVYLKIPGSEKFNIRRWAVKTRRIYDRYQRAFGRPGLILTHSVTWAGYAAALIKETYGVPYIVVEHRSFFVWSTESARQMVKPFYLPFFEKAYRGCSVVAPVSESMVTGLAHLMPWIREKIQVIPNMIREDMFQLPSSTRHHDPFVFLWAGRLEKVKGLDLLISAVARLKERFRVPFVVRLAGRGSRREELEKMALEEGVDGIVRFLGRISREEMQKEMQSAGCFVLPSRYEAFGAVLIEAMATGLPVIATRSGGPDTIVTDRNGLLIDPGDAGQLADAMEEMAGRVKEFSPEGIRQEALAQFGQSKVMARYDQLFIGILSGEDQSSV